MTLKKLLPLSVLVLLLGACSNGGSGGSPQTSAVPTPPAAPPLPTTNQDLPGDFSYEFVVNGCSTGKQKLNSKKAYCDALLDDGLNKSCGREIRVETYNRICTGSATTNLGSLPSMSAARCVVNAMDLKDRTFLDNINPFNPQRRQSFRDMFWDGKREQSYNILFSAVETYGKTRFVMTPATTTFPALGDIQVLQNKGEDAFSLRAGLGSQVRFTVTNYQKEKEVEVLCLSDKAFRRSKADLQKVKCAYKVGNKSTPLREEIVTWDLRNTVQKEVFRGRGKESLIVRLLPASQGKEERIEVEAAELNVDKALKAESTLNEGIEVRYQSKSSGLEIALLCAPASK